MAESERLTPAQFLTQFYYPADRATEQAVELLRVLLGLQDRDSSREAVSGFLVACRGLLRSGDDILGFAHNESAYERGAATYERMRDELVALDYIVLVRKGYKDSRTGVNSISTYKVRRFPDECKQHLRFVHRPPHRLLTVREHKTKFRWATDHIDQGKVLSAKECREKFGFDYMIEELRLKSISTYLERHPLVMNGVSYSGFSRKFNNGRMDRGGRIYTGYSNLKKKPINKETGEVSYPRKTATIDGEKVAYIDISASFLCIRAAMAGGFISLDSDPYSRLPFVVDEGSREFAKVLVSALIANGKPMERYPKGMKSKYAGVTRKHKISYFTDAIYEAFPFLRVEKDGLLVMYHESHIILRTIERCMVAKVPVWPLHDAVFVRVSQVEQAKTILSEEFEKRLGFKPRLSVDYL